MGQLYVRESGAGTPLLLIHGIISDSSFFDGCMPYLQEQYHVLSYDRRGYGNSTQCRYCDFRVQTQAEDAAGILREYASEPAWIFGNSAGGLIALALAMQAPELVKGLVLLEPSLGYDPGEREKLAAWNEELNGYVRMGKTKRALPAFARVMGTVSEADRKTSFGELKRTYRNLDNFLYGELNEVQSYLPEEEHLRAIRVPVVIGVTQDGRDSIFATSSETAASWIGWPVAAFPGCHNVAKDMPGAFSNVLLQLLQKLQGEL
ncbi:MAG: alpha/beta fold hydrolase [Lachnospiraceae bacterium]